MIWLITWHDAVYIGGLMCVISTIVYTISQLKEHVIHGFEEKSISADDINQSKDVFI